VERKSEQRSWASHSNHAGLRKQRPNRSGISKGRKRAGFLQTILVTASARRREGSKEKNSIDQASGRGLSQVEREKK